MLNGQEIYREIHHGKEYICTVTNEQLAFDFCLKHRGEGYSYEEVIICENMEELECWASHCERVKDDD